MKTLFNGTKLIEDTPLSDQIWDIFCKNETREKAIEEIIEVFGYSREVAETYIRGIETGNYLTKYDY